MLVQPCCFSGHGLHYDPEQAPPPCARGDADISKSIGLQVADAVIEIITPVGDGLFQRHLHQFGQGIRSTLFGVRDIDQARRCFTERGVDLAPGGATDTFAVPAESNLGLIFEFSA